jgi:hypothetical protein
VDIFNERWNKMDSMDLEAIAEQQDALKEGATVETVRTLADLMGTSICRVLPTAKEMDTGQWWVSAEVGRCPRMVDLLCHFCTTQGTWSSGTRQGQCCTRSS